MLLYINLIWLQFQKVIIQLFKQTAVFCDLLFSVIHLFSNHSLFFIKDFRPPSPHWNRFRPLHTGLLNDTRFSHRRQLIWSQIRWFNLNEHCCALHVLLFLATFMPPKFIWPLFKYSVFLSPWNSRLHKYLKNFFFSVCYDK